MVGGKQGVSASEDGRGSLRGDEPRDFSTIEHSGGGVKPRSSIVACLLIACALGLPERAGSQAPSGKDVVSPEAFASFDPVARGKSLQIAVVMKICPGFHVNAREVSADYLIPTDLKAEVPAGLKVGEIIYPEALYKRLHFQKISSLTFTQIPW